LLIDFIIFADMTLTKTTMKPPISLSGQTADDNDNASAAVAMMTAKPVGKFTFIKNR